MHTYTKTNRTDSSTKAHNGDHQTAVTGVWGLMNHNLVPSSHPFGPLLSSPVMLWIHRFQGFGTCQHLIHCSSFFQDSFADHARWTRNSAFLILPVFIQPYFFQFLFKHRTVCNLSSRLEFCTCVLTTDHN